MRTPKKQVGQAALPSPSARQPQMAPAGPEISTEPEPLPAERLTGPQLLQWRELRGLTQSQLAVLLPVSARTLRKWEQGKAQPPAFVWRLLQHLEQELSTRDRSKVGRIQGWESNLIIGRRIVGFSGDFEGFERLLLDNGWAVVLSNPQTQSQWYLEDYERMIAAKLERGEVIRIVHESGTINPRVVVKAVKVLLRLKAEGNPDPTPEDIERACAENADWSIEETLAVQADLLGQLNRRRERAEREAAPQEDNDEQGRAPSSDESR